jgi:hypothetical protein
MKTRRTLPATLAILFFIIVLSSCEEDFVTIGADIIGDQVSDAELYDAGTVISYSKMLLPVQTNALPSYQLGIYNDPIYGKTTSNLLSQLFMDVSDPNFGYNISLDSVVLYVPYFSILNITDNDSVYTTDSIFGNQPINISVFESNYFLRDIDPESNFEEAQLYYSNQSALFEGFLGEELVAIEEFVPSSDPYILTEKVWDTATSAFDTIRTTASPGLRAKLPVDFFKQKIINMEGTAELLNNNNFKEYFRGMYFHSESMNQDGSLFLFNIDNAKVTMYYRYYESPLEIDGSTDPDNTEQKGTYSFSFSGINVNTFENNIPASIQSALFNPDMENGEEKLYLKGGEGIITVIDLFGKDLDENGVADELDILREKEWLINEANLIFYVDQDNVPGGDTEPERITIFDIKNNTILEDYKIDITNGEAPVNAINVHLGRLERGGDDQGDYYKIRLTSHISNLINKDSTNVPLGLMVSQNVLLAGFQETIEEQSPGIDGVPSPSVVSPEGTMLYGNATTNEEKRLKLQIFYTEPN